MSTLSDLTTLLDDHILTSIANVLPSPLDASLRAISARFKSIIEPPKKMSASDLRDLGARTSCILMLKVAREHGCHWNEFTCRNDALNGHTAALQWAYEHGCFWNDWTCAYAAANGHLATLQWAHEHGCPWNESTCTYAAENGHTTTLQWAHEHGCPWDVHTYANAARSGNPECLEYVVSHGCPRE